MQLSRAPHCNDGTWMWINFDNLLNVPIPKTDWYIDKYILDNKTFAFNAEYEANLNILSITEEIENKIIL